MPQPVRVTRIIRISATTTTHILSTVVLWFHICVGLCTLSVLWRTRASLWRHPTTKNDSMQRWLLLDWWRRDAVATFRKGVRAIQLVGRASELVLSWRFWSRFFSGKRTMFFVICCPPPLPISQLTLNFLHGINSKAILRLAGRLATQCAWFKNFQYSVCFEVKFL